MFKKMCFIGHREIEITDDLKEPLNKYIEQTILQEDVKVFLFGSGSKFDELCYDIVTKLKEKYPYIKRVYVRSNFECISDDYKQYLLEFYEETMFPEECANSGKISYIKRNQAMINQSDYCVFYYNENYLPPKRKTTKKNLFAYQPRSGTALAYRYAKQKKKLTINFYN